MTTTKRRLQFDPTLRSSLFFSSPPPPPLLPSPPCGLDRAERRLFGGLNPNTTRTGLSELSRGRFPAGGEAAIVCGRALRFYAQMAGVEDAALPVTSWLGGMGERLLYRRHNYIHEMSCSEVGAHLYSRMCCAGRTVRPRACFHL